MEYEFNISPDAPAASYGTEGNLDTSLLKDGQRIISKQRSGFIEIDAGKRMLVKDGEILDLPQEVVERLQKPQPVSRVLFYTQSSVYCDTYFFMMKMINLLLTLTAFLSPKLYAIVMPAPKI